MYMDENRVFDVTIIGAGIVGANLARELSKYRLNVLLLEKESDVAMGATKSNSAIVHGGYAESHTTLKGRLCYPGRKKFQVLEEELEFGFNPCGSLVVAFHEGDIKELQYLLENGLANGIPADELEIWHRDELHERVPGISEHALAALFCAGAGICSPYSMAIALIENAIRNGLSLRLNEAVIELDRDSEDLFTLRTSKGLTYRSKRLVNCAGAGAETIARQLGIEGVNLYGRSGEYILLDRGSDSLIPYVLFGMPTKMGKGILLSPTIHGNLIIGPDAGDLKDMTAEEAAKEGLDTHEDRLLRIWKEGNELIPGLPVSKIIRDFAGVRTAAASGDFIIGRDPAGRVPAYYQAAGIQSPGLTCAPEIADMLISMMQEDGMELEADQAFEPRRKAYVRPLASAASHSPKKTRSPLPPEELEARLKLEASREGRMICRCEQVSEEAVLAALRQGIKITTVDALKRRSRAGMGRCQGAFCRSRVFDVLKRELDGDDIVPDMQTDVERKAVRRVGAARLRKLISEAN